MMGGNLFQRFMSFVDTESLNGCWLWKGGHKGAKRLPYASFWYNNKTVLGHKFIYEAMACKKVPKGYQIDHTCKQSLCVNPFHLEMVTTQVNIERSNGTQTVNSRKTECKHGHEFTKANTYINPRGERQCRKCLSQSCKTYKHKLKGQYNGLV